MDPITIAVFVVLISSFLLVFGILQRKHSLNYWQSRNVPCIEPSFLFGNLKNVGKTQHLAFTLSDIYHKFKVTGSKYCGVYFWSKPVALILDLDVMKDILIKDFHNFSDRGLYYSAKDDPLSANLATVDGDDWKKLRPKLSPTFSSGKLKYIFPSILKVAERLADVTMEFVMQTDDEVNIHDFILRYNADVIGTVALGIESNSLKDSNSEFIRIGRSINSKPRHGAEFNILIQTFPNVARWLGIKLLRDDLASFFMNAVTETVNYREKNNVRRDDMMDILINTKNQHSSDPLTLNEIAANAYIFFFGGLDSTSVELTYCFYEMAMNPDIQTKARNEVLDALARHNGEFTYGMLSELTYVERVLRETTRKYPLSASINRFAKNDYRVSGTNHVLERSTWVKMPMYAIQHDPEIYPDPERFSPDRFEPNEYRKRDVTTLLTFGEGPRGCIGERLAMMNMNIALAIMLKNFEFSKCRKTMDKISFNPKRTVLVPNEDIILRVRPIVS